MALGLPVIHLDHLFWLPNWKERSREEFDSFLKQELEKESWIIEGDYFRTLPMRAEKADLVIRLDYNRFICVYRAIKRYFQGKLQAKGCDAKLGLQFLWYIFWRYPKVQRTRQNEIKDFLLDKFPSLKWVDIKSPRRAEVYIEMQKTKT